MRFEFAGFRFDPERGLDRGGRAIHLQPKQQRVLALLLGERGKLLTKDQIAARAWGDEKISDDSIFRAIYRLRQALEHPDGIDVIATVHGSGFRIAVPVATSNADPEASASAMHPGASPAALESLMTALEFRGRRTPEDLAMAIDAAGRATTLDPAYLPAWTTLAELHLYRATRWYRPPLEALADARKAAESALHLEPRSPMALAVHGCTRLICDLDCPGALAELDEAVAIDPSAVALRIYRSWCRMACGRLDLAESDLRAALEVNPYAAWAQPPLVICVWFQGRTEQALVEAREFALRCPTVDNNLNLLAVTAALCGHHEESIEAGHRAAALSPSSPQMQTGLLCGLLGAGRTDEARELLARLENPAFRAPPSLLAPILADLGKRERAIALLEEARREREPSFFIADYDRRLAAIVDDEAGERLWAEVRAARAASPIAPGLPPSWRT